MNSHDTRAFEMFVRVEGFGAHQADDFPPASLGGQAFADLNAVVAELQHSAAIQAKSSGGARLGTATKATARATLRAAMTAHSRTARAMAIDTPGLENKFRVPRTGDQAMLNAARAFVEDAEPLKAKFIQHEMPADFIEELKRHIDAFQAAVNEQNSSTEARVKATSSLDSLMERGLTAVHRLDAIVKNKYRNDRATLSAWASASHIERHSRRATRESNADAAKAGASGASVTS